MYHNYQSSLRDFWGFLRRVCALSLCALSTAAAGADSVTLAWDANPQPDIAGYRVKYGTVSREYTQTLEVGAATRATVADLAVGNTYFFAVTAYNAADMESKPSNEVSFTVPRFQNSTYNGLVTPDTGAETRGFFNFKITPTGLATGRAVLNGVVYTWLGAFDLQNHLNALIPRADGLGYLTLTLDIDEATDTVIGAISDDLFSATIHADRATFSATTNETPLKGRYTVAMDPNAEASAQPQGYGFATLKVSGNGRARLAGRLADGTKFTLGAFVSKDGRMPVSAALYHGGGYAFGEITFQETPDVSDASAVLLWSKPEKPDAARFTAGFTTELPLRAARYVYVPGLAILDGLVASGGKATLSFNGGDLPADGIVDRTVAILPTTNLTVVFPPNMEQISFVVRPETGMLSGLLTPLGEPTRPFKAILFQKGAGCAYGTFLSATQSGQVVLEPGE